MPSGLKIKLKKKLNPAQKQKNTDIIFQALLKPITVEQSSGKEEEKFKLVFFPPLHRNDG